MKKLSVDLAVLGGGASGLTAAICAARKNKGKNIVILEAQERVGKKILVTGNGRCNLLNENISLKNYNFDAHDFLKPLFKIYTKDRVLEFFHSLGLLIRVDTEGRVYPFSGQASAVLDVLRLECKNLNISEICSFDIENISLKGNKFIIKSNEFEIVSKNIIFSTGGAAFFNYKYFEKIYFFLNKLGHTYKDFFPALVPVRTNSVFESYLKGIRSKAKVKLLADNVLIKEELGEIQFTDKGLSGICIFQISRLISEFFSSKKINGKKYKKLSIDVDLLPNLELNDIVMLLSNRVLNSKLESIENLFAGIINKKFLIPILKASGVPYKNRKLESLLKDEIIKIAKTIKKFSFIPCGTMPFKNAQVMSGGVNLFEINNSTLESLKVENMYITGELLNVDGDCGGYNLYWAWISGMIAGNSVNL